MSPVHPCGLVVDLLRASHKADMRMYADSPQTTEVWWYFTPPGRAVIPFPTVFGNTEWEGDDIGWRRNVGRSPAELGEQIPPGGSFRFYRGTDAWGAPALQVCGTREQWAGQTGAAPGVPATGLVPACCWLGNHQVHNASGVLPLSLRADGSRKLRMQRRGSAALLLGAGGQRGLGRSASGMVGLSLTAGGFRNLGLARVGLAVLSLGASGTRTLARTGSGDARLKLTADSIPAGSGRQERSPGCAQATHTPNRVRVTVTGTANGSCSDCANANASFTLTYVSGCNWSGPGPTLCATARTLNFGNGGGNMWFVGVSAMAGFWSVTLGSAWDGRSTLTLTGGPTGGFCNFPATITVTPI